MRPAVHRPLPGAPPCVALRGAVAGIAEVKGTRVSVPPKNRLFLRTVAAAFDTHFVAGPKRHAKAV